MSFHTCGRPEFEFLWVGNPSWDWEQPEFKRNESQSSSLQVQVLQPGPWSPNPNFTLNFTFGPVCTSSFQDFNFPNTQKQLESVRTNSTIMNLYASTKTTSRWFHRLASQFWQLLNKMWCSCWWACTPHLSWVTSSAHLVAPHCPASAARVNKVSNRMQIQSFLFFYFTILFYFRFLHIFNAPTLLAEQRSQFPTAATLPATDGSKI